MISRVLLVGLVLSACGNSAAPPQPSASPGPGSSTAQPSPVEPDRAPAPVADCGHVDARTTRQPANAETAYRCFADAFTAGRGATVKSTAVTIEGGLIVTTYRIVPGAAGREVEITIDDHDDGFAASPGVHVRRCRSVSVAPTSSNSVALRPADCS